MKYFVNADKRIFAYDDEVIDIPAGLTPVSKAEVRSRLSVPVEQLIEQAEQDRKERINDATREIAILLDAVELSLALR